MEVYRKKTKMDDGAVQEAKRYTVRVRDHLGIPRKYPGLKDKRLTIALGNQIELLAAYKRSGQPLDAMLCEWLQGVPDKLRTRLAKLGLIDRNRASAGKPLAEHLSDYRVYIGNDTKHAEETHSALKRLFSDCKFAYFQDLQASRLYNHLVRLRTRGVISQRTFNKWLKASQSFCRWAVEDRRAHESPLSHLRPITITERKVNRRALEDDELQRLLAATATGPERYGMSGYERYLIYRFAIESGFRGNEVRSLTVSSFNFDACTVSLEVGSSKRRRADVQTLKPSTALLLKEFFKNKLLIVKAFGGTYRRLTNRTAEMIREDLKDAGIPYVDEAGRVFDFHSLRHQCGTMLARAGVHPKDAQAHMRHSSIVLTMEFYTHLRKGGERETAAKIPDMSIKDKAERQAG